MLFGLVATKNSSSNINGLNHYLTNIVTAKVYRALPTSQTFEKVVLFLTRTFYICRQIFCAKLRMSWHFTQQQQRRQRQCFSSPYFFYLIAWRLAMKNPGENCIPSQIISFVWWSVLSKIHEKNWALCKFGVWVEKFDNGIFQSHCIADFGAHFSLI